MKLEEIEQLIDAATPGPWKLCFHLQSKENDEKCRCGYRGSIWGGDKEAVVCEMGSTVIKGEEGLEPPGYGREQELINARFIAASRTLMRKFAAVAEAAKALCGDEFSANYKPLMDALAALEQE